MASKFLENKQMIHIASEVVVLMGLTFYFSSKNKKLMGHIEELAQKVEAQEDQIQKLETSLKQAGEIMGKFNTRIHGLEQNAVALAQSRAKKVIRKVRAKPVQKAVNPKRHIRRVNKPHPGTVVETQETQPVSSDVTTALTNIQKTLEDEDLDEEISQELQELDQEESDADLNTQVQVVETE